MPRLLIDLKTDCHGDIVGRVDIPSDSTFTLEALAEVIERFSASCGVPVIEVLSDLKGLCK